MKSRKYRWVPQPGVDYEMLTVSGMEATVKVFFPESPPVNQTAIVRRDARGKTYVRVRFGASVRRIYL